MKKEKTNEQARAELRQELVEHFREKRDLLREQWVQQMTAKGLLAGLTQVGRQTEGYLGHGLYRITEQVCRRSRRAHRLRALAVGRYST